MSIPFQSVAQIIIIIVSTLIIHTSCCCYLFVYHHCYILGYILTYAKKHVFVDWLIYLFYEHVNCKYFLLVCKCVQRFIKPSSPFRKHGQLGHCDIGTFILLLIRKSEAFYRRKVDYYIYPDYTASVIRIILSTSKWHHSWVLRAIHLQWLKIICTDLGNQSR